MYTTGVSQIVVGAASFTLDGGTPASTLSLSGDGIQGYVVTGTATLTSSLTLQYSGTPAVTLGVLGYFYWNADVLLNGNTLTFFGVSVPQAYLNKGGLWVVYYDGTGYGVAVLPNFTLSNLVRTASIEDGAVTNAKLATGIDGAKILAGSVPGTALSSGLALANSQLATMPTLTLKGNNTGGSATPSDLTVTQIRTMLGVDGLVSGTGVDSFEQVKTVGTPPSATGVDSFAWGSGTLAARRGEWSRDNTVGTKTVIRQYGETELSVITSDATPTTMLLGGSGGGLFTIKNNTLVQFEAMISAVQTGGTSGTVGDYICFSVFGSIRNNGGTTGGLRLFYKTYNGVIDGLSASPSVISGTAQAGGASTITLETSQASLTNGYYNGYVIFITGGTGAGQARLILDYVGSTEVATVASWTTPPDNTSTYRIVVHCGLFGASLPSYIDLAANNTSDSLDINVTGEVDKVYQWYCHIRYLETQFA
jgi:hypothetical protein